MRFFDYQYLLECNESKAKLNSQYSTIDAGYFLFLGNIAPWKGIDILLEAARLVYSKVGQKFRLVITGEPYPGFKDVQFFNALDNHDAKYIRMISKFITSAEIPALVGKSSCLVLPYNNLFRNSASGVIPLSYTLSKPVIVSNIPSLAEYVEDGKTGLIFDIEDSKQLASCIIELIENNSRLIEMGQKAHEKLLKEMSLDMCCRTIKNVYNKLN